MRKGLFIGFLFCLLCHPLGAQNILLQTENLLRIQPKKFNFGAKVKAMLSSGEEMEGVLIGIDTEDHDTPFEVAVRDEDASFNYTTYWVKSVTYID